MHRRFRPTRLIALTALTALTAFLLPLAVFVTPASATTNVIADSSADNGPSYDPRGDITGTGGDYRDGGILLSLRLPYATNPASDVNWNTVGRTTGAIWDLDVNGDSVKDYRVYLLGGLSSGPLALVDDAAGNQVCNATWTWDADGFIFVDFPASCIGHPTTVAMNAFLVYSTSSGASRDYAPSSGFCCSMTEGDPAPPPPPTTTTTTTAPVPVDPPVSSAGVHDGYWMLGQNGQVYGFGSANGAVLANSQPFVHIEPTPTGKGYWGLTDGGNIIPKGDAAALSSVGVFPGEKAVSLSSTPSGKGAWVFTDRGRVMTLGDAQSFGDMSSTPLNGKIVGSVATPTGFGYWMVGSDGGIFSFGDAKFHGSTGAVTLNKPVMSMAPAQDGSGYWLVASDGGIFAFDVPFYGSMGGTPLNKPISGMVPGSGGYMMVGQDGGIFSFGSVAFHGSLGANPPGSPVVSVALQP